MSATIHALMDLRVVSLQAYAVLLSVWLIVLCVEIQGSIFEGPTNTDFDLD